MKTIFLLSIIAIIVFIAGCHKCDKKDEHYYLDPEDKLDYKVNDKLVYKSNLGDRNTIELDYINNQIRFYPFGGDCDKNGYYSEVLAYFFKDTIFDYSVTFKIKSNFYFAVNRGVFDSHYSPFIILPEYQLNNNIYTNVYLFTEDTLNNYLTNFVWKVYFSKSKGVLSFSIYQGKTWEFEKIISQSKSI